MKPNLKEKNGSVIIIFVITILFVAIAFGVILSMNLSSSLGQTDLGLSNQAYLSAESGFKYGVYQFIKKSASLSIDDAVSSLHGLEKKIKENTKFVLSIKPYWFKLSTKDSNEGKSPGLIPDTITAAKDKSGYISVNNSLIHFSKLKIPDDNSENKVEFEDAVINSTAGADIYFAGKVKNDTTLNEGDDLELTEGGYFFPLQNGMLEIDNGLGEKHYVTYSSRSGNKLQGIKEVKYAPSLPLSLSSGASVVLKEHADIISKGYVLSADENNTEYTRTVTYSQPLKQIEYFRVKEAANNFDDGKDWFSSIYGSHSITENPDGSGKVLKITGTKENEYYKGAFLLQVKNKFNESLMAMDQTLDKTLQSLGLKDLWTRSEKKLSYDFQTKIRFSAADDKDVNYLGTYMPGVAFRLKDKDHYYGISFMRGIPGTKNHWFSNGDIFWKECKDDIPDTFFESHHMPYTGVGVLNSDGKRYVHVDKDLIPGMPYLVFWQKAEKGYLESALKLKLSSDDKVSDNLREYEWLSNLPLCDYVKMDAYYYPPGSKPVECDCSNISSWRFITKGICNLCKKNNDSSTLICRPFWSWEGVPERGWYVYKEGANPDSFTYPSDKSLRKGPFKVLMLKDKFNVLKRETGEDGITYLGHPIGTTFKNPDTGKAFNQDKNGSPVAFIADKDEKFSGLDEFDLGSFNYAIYLKDFVTLAGRIVEFNITKDKNGNNIMDKDGNPVSPHCNAVMAWIASPEDISQGKIKWPEDTPDSILKSVHWYDYTSKPYYKTILGINLTKFNAFYDFFFGTDKNANELPIAFVDGIEEIKNGETMSKQDDNKNSISFSPFFTTEGYEDKDWQNLNEVGLHTFGIDANAGEAVYFDDFSFRLLENQSYLLPGVQSE